MKWKKLGRIFSPNSLHPKLQSHASNPLALPFGCYIYRVFYSGRDVQNRSSVGFVDIDIIRRKVVYEHSVPIFTYGDDDSFYSHGVSIGNAYVCNGKTFILFMGWKIRLGEHWKGIIGRLELVNDHTLQLNPEFPFLNLDEEDAVSLSYPWVIVDQGFFKMWYGSTLSWNGGNGEMIHVIKYATSADGLHWEKQGQALRHEIGVMQAFSRPTVLIDHDGYHMWFSYRDGKGSKYRIGYAHSKEGLHWHTKVDQTGIDVSRNGWDSEMIEYPYVFDHKGERFMLYNGNGYGKTGFGLAILDQD